MSKIFNPKFDFSNKSKRVLKKYGECPIVKIFIQRTPINKNIEKALNFISLGKWKKNKHKFKFDTFFHLNLIITVRCKNKRLYNIIVEKNEIVNITDKINIKKDSEFMFINKKIDHNLTINKMLSSVILKYGLKNIFIYDSFTWNCQDFILKLLNSNKLLNDTYKKFILQKISELVQDLPVYVKWFNKIITGTGAFYHKLVGTGI